MKQKTRFYSCKNATKSEKARNQDFVTERGDLKAEILEEDLSVC